jgi:radical SAM PhpK family P-methyltransferase
MSIPRYYDCIVIGHNEMPFADYEQLIRSYGTDSETYRDLRFSFLDIQGKKSTYLDLLNYAHERTVWRECEEKPFASGDMPHLASAYLSNFLRRKGLSSTYINLFQPCKDQLRALLAENPLCVAITTTLYVLNFPATEIVDFVRECNPAVKIVIGGPLIANHARNNRTSCKQTVQIGGLDEIQEQDPFHAILEDIGADIYVVESQGELTLSRIVKALKTNGNINEITNLIYREGDNFRETGTEPENNDLNEVDIDWRTSLDSPLGPTIQMRTARSCAFKCAFCNYPTRAGKLSLSSLETVQRELDSIRDLGDAKNVVFIDDTFNVPLERFKEICRMMIARDYGFNWFSYFRCSNSDEEAIDLMARSGCKGVFLGIESGSPAILKNMNKAATVEKYKVGIELLRSYQIASFASFIVGFPGETRETLQETIDFIRGNRPDFYRAQLWYCEPGTPIQQQRATFDIQGQAFSWSHKHMNSREAMELIEQLFLSISESAWLPQWSFDFWILPYLLGRNISIEKIKEFVAIANQLLALEIAGTPSQEKYSKQRKYLDRLLKAVPAWYASEAVLQVG